MDSITDLPLKRCSHCKRDLPLSEYQKNRKRLDGLQDRCKACRRAHDEDAARKAHKAEYDRFYRADDLASWHAQQPQPDPTVKTCAKCGETKPLTDYYRNSKRADGVQTYCKACSAALDAARKPKAPPRPRAVPIRVRTGQAAAERRAVQAHERGRLSSAPMKVCRRCEQEKPKGDYTEDERYTDGRYPWCADCRRAWRQGRREKQRELHTNWRENNRERARAYKRNYYHQHKDILAPRRQAYDRERYKNDPLHRQRKNRQTNEKNRRRKARLYGAPVEHHTEQEWQALCERYDHRCLRCGLQIPLSRDHIVPVTKGGSDAITNLQPLCRVCNSWKNNRTIDFRPEWED